MATARSASVRAVTLQIREQADGIRSFSYNKGNTKAYSVKKVIQHPQFSLINKHASNDFAIIELAEPVNMSMSSKPICLPPDTSTSYLGSDAIVTGWGRTESSSSSKILQKAHLKIIEAPGCIATYARRGWVINGESMLCADAPLADACCGDSGGPLIVPEMRDGKPKHWTLVNLDNHI